MLAILRVAFVIGTKLNKISYYLMLLRTFRKHAELTHTNKCVPAPSNVLSFKFFVCTEEVIYAGSIGGLN